MSKKVFKSNLSQSGIKNMIRELERYKNSLDRKLQMLISELLKIGVTVAETNVSESPLGKYVTLSTNIKPSGKGYDGILLAKGQVMEHEDFAPFSVILAIEFGAGIHYNPAPNPKSAEMGYGVGTFPGQIHAWNPGGWSYWSEEQQRWIHTYGIKATMPMYEAHKEMLLSVEQIAKEVFK